MSLIFQKYFLSIFILLFQQFNRICLKGIVETLSTTNPLIDKRPPNLYKWIEENAHICTIVPVNGESLVSFLSEEEGKKCSICPDLGINEVPTMACAVEVTPNDIENLDIGCHKLPDLCVIELKNRYAEFYMNISLDKEVIHSSKPPKPFGDKSTSSDFKRSEEEKIFQATDSLFSTKSLNLFSSKEKNEIEKDEEEEQKVEFEGTREEELGKVFEGLKGEGGLQVVTTSIRPTTIKTASPNFKLDQSTTIRANIFAQMDGQEGIPLNIKMTPMSTGRRILSEGEKEQIIFPPSQNNENEIIEKIQKRVKNKENLIEEEEIEEEKEEKSFCKDTHELCCFWAVAGECNNNPFWMRVKCPMTCGTCGCKVKNANKCKSTGVKCILPTTTTTTTEATTSTTSTSTSRSTPTSTSTPTPPPSTSTTPSNRRRPRPTPPPKMPGHRPQRPKQSKSTFTTTKLPKIVSQETEYQPLIAPFISSFGDGGGGGSDSDSDSDKNDNFDNLFNRDYSEEVEEPRMETTLIPFKKHSITFTRSTQIYEEEDFNKNEKKLKEGEKKRKINLKNKTTPLAPITSPTETSKTLTTIKTSINTTIITTTKQTCFNYHKLCEFWAEMGECLSNPFWMRPHCQKSCSSCGETLGDISTPTPRRGCTNVHILCPFWGFIGECERNPRWMGMHCRASCQLC